jgi:hypothetical protein
MREGPLPAGPAEIAVFGPSSAMGWGVTQEETYAKRLQARLPEGRLVLNFSQIGHTILQGRRLFEEAEAANPAPLARTILLAYGINELDRYRFFGKAGISDREYLQEISRQPATIFSSLLHSSFFSLLHRAGQELVARATCPPDQPIRPRVDFAEFEGELVSFVRRIRETGSFPMLLDTGIHYGIEPSESLALKSDFLYEEGVDLARRHWCANAKQVLAEARELEVFRIVRDAKRINKIVRRVGKEESVPVIMISQLPLRAPEHFVDPVHFSALGHQKIADETYRIWKTHVNQAGEVRHAATLGGRQ